MVYVRISTNGDEHNFAPPIIVEVERHSNPRPSEKRRLEERDAKFKETLRASSTERLLSILRHTSDSWRRQLVRTELATREHLDSAKTERQKRAKRAKNKNGRKGR